MATQPIYQRIEREIRQRLALCEDGERLASEPQLAQEFGVSRMTVRAALAGPERDGLIERVPGRGSFARRAPATRGVATLVSFHDQAIELGRSPRSELLEAAPRTPTAEESAALGHPAMVLGITRVRLFDQTPIALERAAFPTSLAGLLEIDLEKESIHLALRRLGYHLTSGSSVLSARAAGPDADWLRVSRDTALLVESRTISDRVHGPLEHTTSAYVPTRYTLRVDFRVNATGSLAPADAPPSGGPAS